MRHPNLVPLPGGARSRQPGCKTSDDGKHDEKGGSGRAVASNKETEKETTKAKRASCICNWGLLMLLLQRKCSAAAPNRKL